MAKEIERKFLVVDDSYKVMAHRRKEISQGYLCIDVDATVRVRICDDMAWITVKSRTCGATRGEWEYSVPAADAREMLDGCCGSRVIEKTRWYVDAGDGLCWEVDEFHGRHEGLVVAEIELPSEETPFVKAAFVGEEVTGKPEYYNSSLASGTLP